MTSDSIIIRNMKLDMKYLSYMFKNISPSADHGVWTEGSSCLPDSQLLSLMTDHNQKYMYIKKTTKP